MNKNLKRKKSYRWILPFDHAQRSSRYIDGFHLQYFAKDFCIYVSQEYYLATFVFACAP